MKEDIVEYTTEKLDKKIKKLSLDELLNIILKIGEVKVSRRYTQTLDYDRNPYVTEYSRLRARGRCELCKEEAPFLNKHKEPYLEVHHIEWLSKGGSDRVENTAGLCPNCHRKMHILNDKKDICILKKLRITDKI